MQRNGTTRGKRFLRFLGEVGQATARGRRRGHFAVEQLEPRHLLAAELMISEIMYHPASGSYLDEWIELVNAGDAPIGLNGYRFSRGVDFTFPDVILAPGEYLVVAADQEAFRANHPEVTNVLAGWNGQLSNSGESVELVDPLGTPADLVDYADSGDWAARRRGPLDLGARGWTWEASHDGEGRSLSLINLSLDNELAHNWTSSLQNGGTPGIPNDVSVSDIAPAIADVAHSPLIPQSGDEVTVTARIVDELSSGVSVGLAYRVSQLDPIPFLEVPMFDDGLHGDGASQDGIFGAILPAQADGTVVEFYVQATDSGGQQRTLPGPTDDLGGQEANLLYQVDDTVRLDDVTLLRTIMTVPERELFRTMNRNSDAQMNATLIGTAGGRTEVRYNVGVRYRGSGTRNNNPPNNRINIPEDRPYLGVTQLNINSNNPHNQIAGSVLFAMAGIPVAHTMPIRRLDNGVDLANGGYYAYVEVLNSDWADQHFPLDSGGNAYLGRRANEGPPGGQGAGLRYLGDNPAVYVSYVKRTNTAEADYSDVMHLTDVLNNTPDETYLEQVSQVVNIDQWLRTLAMVELSGYSEFSLLTGDAQGDDYAMYRGVEDPRFLMMPYDLDGMFNDPAGDIFSAMSVPALNRLLNHPEVMPRFYAQFVDLIENVLPSDKIRPALEQMLEQVITQNRISTMVNYLESRAANVLSRIPRELTAGSTLPNVGGLPTTSEATVRMTGRADAITTRSVVINGQSANWNPRTGRWNLDEIALLPGVNRLLVRALDGDGAETQRVYIDVYRDTGSLQEISETIATDTTWTAAAGPYRIVGNVTLSSDAVLNIEPGTTVFFAPGARLTVRGELIAEGTEQQQIRFTRQPEAGGTWGGLQFVNSRHDNRIQHAVVEYGVTDDGLIGLQNSQLELDHVTLDHTDLRRIRSINSSLVVRNSIFTDIFAPGQAPTTDNRSEHIWGQGIPADGQFVIDGNVFGHLTGHNDAIDFDAPRLPNPIPQILNNVFVGGGDDALDMTGDVYLEGNLFQHFRKDQFNTDPGQSNAISASGGTYTVVRNVFHDVDHVSLVKENALMDFAQNTVVGVALSALYFDLPGQTTGPGRGAHVSGSIFDDTLTVLDVVEPTTELTVDYSFVNPTDLDRGVGNLAGDPRVDASGDFGLLPGSPATGTGPNGADMGARVPVGASIDGEPPATTRQTTATLTVGGPGITHYRFRMNDGPLSDEQAVETPIVLTDLVDGDYTVYVIGRNVAGAWQEETAATASRTWTVDQQLSRIVINEVLAANEGVFPHEGTLPDVVEIYNDSDTAADLSGMSLTDDPLRPRRFVFPQGTTIGPGDYLLVYADDPNATSGLHLGFGLSRDGESLSLLDRPANGSGLIDSVSFGLQIPDLSIGRDSDGQWTLTSPTLGGPNQPVALGDPNGLRINEWLASADVSVNNDFIELFNPDPAPIDLGGLHLTDHPMGWPNRHPIAPLSFIAGQGLAVLIADSDPQDGPDHLNFGLSATWEMIGLFDDESQLIDQVLFGPQRDDVSQGLAPNGGVTIVEFALPNPGVDNPLSSSEQVSLLELTDTFRYEQSGTDLGTAWRNPEFDDSAWPSGPGVLYAEDEPLPVPKGTPLTLGNTTYYFRSTFQIDEDVTEVTDLRLTTAVDDGAVVYLNGQEVARVGMPGGDINYDTYANRHVGEADFESFTIPVELLVPGDNILAGEAHQENATSDDIVFGAALTATLRQGGLDQLQRLMDGLRITELMYNPLGDGDLEFVELLNVSDVPLNLTGVRIEGGIAFTFPSLQLGPQEYAVVVSDLAQFRARYGMSVPVAGVYSGSLSNGGEEILLRLPEPHRVNILDFAYDDFWYPSTDGLGFSLVIDDPMSARSAWRESSAWRASHFVGGSPGFPDAGLDAGIIVVNEVLSRTDQPSGDRIELYNTSGGPLDIGGWYLSDDPRQLNKYPIPSGTTIPPGGYVVFDQQTHFGSYFSLNDRGGEVHLATPDAVGDVTGFHVTAQFGAADPDITQGRHIRSDGVSDFVALASNTLGDQNSAPLVGPVVFNEIMYHPTLAGDEFIELHNATDQVVSLGDAGDPLRAWQLRGAVEYVFPADAAIQPGGYLLVVPSDPAIFRAQHDVPAEVPVFGPYVGDLQDDGDDLRLYRPGQPLGDGIPSILAERVAYDDQSPWPETAGGQDVALNRVDVDQYANDPVNWLPSIAQGTPGHPNLSADITPPTSPTDLNLTIAAGPAIELRWTAATDPESGVTLYQVYRDDSWIGSSTTPMFSDTAVLPQVNYRYEVTAVNGQGLEGNRSTLQQIAIMAVEEVTSFFESQVRVVFSEPVERTAAEDIANYTIGTINIVSAVLAADERSVTLTTSTLQPDVIYQLTIGQISGPSGNALPPGTQTSFVFVPPLPGFKVRGIRSNDVQIRSLDTADLLLALPPDDPQIADDQTRIYGTVNFLDDDTHTVRSQFDQNVSFPTDEPGDDNDFLIQATGIVTIPPQVDDHWTFGVTVSSANTFVTDGFRLRIDGNDVLTGSSGNPLSQQLGQVTLAAGTYLFDLVYYERSGGSEVELFAAPGSFSQFDQTNSWRLVGDVDAGGLSVATEPPLRPISWQRSEPLGSLVFESTQTEELPAGRNGAIYRTRLLAGQTLSVAVSPERADAMPTLTLRNSSEFVATVMANPGTAALIQDYRVTADDTYTLVVGSQVPTEATLRVLLNASLESESLAGGAANDQFDAAQDIDGSLIELTDGAERLAVRGHTEEGSADHFRLSLVGGVPVTLAVTPEAQGEVGLWLLDEAGVARARGIAVPRSGELIRDFIPPDDGNYVVAVNSEEPLDYNLIITRNADLDLLPNDDLASATHLLDYTTVLGGLGGSGGSGDVVPGSVPVFLPLDLFDADGFLWDIQYDGSISDGTSDAYDGGLRLSGFPYPFEAAAENNGRQIVLGPEPLGSVSVTRKIYVPQDQAYARFLEIVTNTGDTPVTYDVSLSTNLGSDDGTLLVGESSGDDQFTPDDNWIVTDDAQDGGGDPTMTHVVAGDSAQRPTLATWTTGADDIRYDFQLQLAPGETQVVMHFAAQSNSRAEALQKAEQLAALQLDSLAGMSAEEVAALVNFRPQDGVDHFALQLVAGAQLVVDTDTPDSGADGRENTLDVHLEVFDPNGQRVAQDDNGAGDGRNAHLEYLADTAGTYTVRVNSQSGEGEYLLRVSGAAASTPTPLAIVDSLPAHQAQLEEIPTHLTLELSTSVDLAAVQATDVSVGGLLATGVEALQGNRLRFNLDPAYFVGTGTYAVEIAAGALMSLRGVTNEHFTSEFYVDDVAPRMVSTRWNGQPLSVARELPAGDLVFSARFDEPLSDTQLDWNDIQLTNLLGQPFFRPPLLEYDDSTNSLTATFYSVPEGDYQLSLVSGDGAFEDLVGNDFDGEPVGQSRDGTVTGDGVDGGSYAATFRVISKPVDIDNRFVRVAPQGSLALRASVSELISFPGDVDTYQVMLERGETLLTQLQPLAIDGVLSIELQSPSSQRLAFGSTTGADQPTGTPLLVAPATGTYQLIVSGDLPGQPYTLSLLRNAALEETDIREGDPLSLDNTRIDLGPGRLVVQATAVVSNPSTVVWGVQPASGQIVLLDPATGNIALRYAAPGDLRPEHTQIGLAMADLGQALLYLNSDADPTALYRLDPFTGEVLSVETIPPGPYDGLGSDAGVLFYSRDGVDLRRQPGFDAPADDDWATGVPHGGVAGDDYGREFAFFEDGLIHEFDTRRDTDALIGTVTPPAIDIEGMAFDGDRLYVATASGRLYSLRPDAPEDEQLVSETTVPGGALYGLAALAEAGGVGSGQITEDEPNNSIANAYNIDGEFSLDANNDIGNQDSNTSTQIPHVTIVGRGDDTFDFYQFTVANAGDRGIFDIDRTSNLDSYLRLYDSSGMLLNSSDDADISWGAGGSTDYSDSFLEHTFSAPGTYYIEVGSCCVGPVYQGARYRLHVSIENHALPLPGQFELVSEGETWKYWDRGVYPGGLWVVPARLYNDSAWSVGRAEFGYGDQDERTVVSYGPDPNNKYVTTYFRHTFELSDISRFTEGLQLELLRDDGAAVYFNSVPIVRDRLPVDPSLDTLAQGDPVEGPEESTFYTFNFPTSWLEEGSNTIAVEVHQQSVTSDDLSFDLRLWAPLVRSPRELPLVADTDDYTIDLTDQIGSTIDVLVVGQSGADFSQQTLQLLDPHGAIVATGSATHGDLNPTSFDLGILGYRVSQDGVYTLRFVSTTSGPYSLVISEGAVWDSEPNQEQTEPLRSLDDSWGAIGSLPIMGVGTVSDPAGDTIGLPPQHDILSVGATVEGNTLNLSMTFVGSIEPTTPGGIDGAYVYFELDTDQDPSTGNPSFQSQLGAPGQQGGPLGVDYLVLVIPDFPDTAIVFEVVDTQYNQMGEVPLLRGDRSLEAQVPLSMIGDTDGLLNLGSVTGHQNSIPTDTAPDTTFLTAGQAGEVVSEHDLYQLNLEADQTLQLETATPLQRSLPGQSALDLELTILDAAGNVVAQDQDSAADHRNAAIRFTASETAAYWVRIQSQDGGGEYTLHAELVDPDAVVGRHLFYNNSAFDGADLGAGPLDDQAMALDKVALRPGETASWANYTSYSRGINGIMVDLPNPGGIPTAADFDFRVGNNDQPGSWQSAPDPTSVTIRPGAGVAGSDRVTVIWQDNLIENQWLQVIVLANDTTGLSAPDRFYFGNIVGESGDSPEHSRVDVLDEIAARNHPHTFLFPAAVDDPFDFNRDQRVDATDQLIARRSLKSSIEELHRLTAPNDLPAPLVVDALLPQWLARVAARLPARPLLQAARAFLADAEDGRGERLARDDERPGRDIERIASQGADVVLADVAGQVRRLGRRWSVRRALSHEAVDAVVQEAQELDWTVDSEGPFVP